MMYQHRGAYVQRGQGIGTVLVSIFRGLVPILKRSATSAVKIALKGGAKAASSKVVKHAAKKAIKVAKKEAIKAGLNTLGTAIQGGNVKESAKKDLNEARDQIGKTIKRAAARGGKRKRTADNAQLDGGVAAGGAVVKKKTGKKNNVTVRTGLV